MESSLPDTDNCQSYLFNHPHRILAAKTSPEIPDLFAAIESELSAGRWVAGWFAYEAGSHFLELPGRSGDGPLATLGVYDAPAVFHHTSETQTADHQVPLEPLNIALIPALSHSEYEMAITRIGRWISAGETYQLNFTTRLSSPCPHTALHVYQALSAQQPSSFSAIVNFPNQPTILSFSPELFFRVDTNGTIVTRPMKGTAPRSANPAEDQQAAVTLQNDEKNRAEHVMIVDLLRNDLNRICRTGSVQADDLFHVESYETLHQMTSRVSGSLAPDTPWYRVFQALFPGGSITGAPKRHTAELIQQVETEPRGVYTGAIGYFAPDRTATFNIAIRTAVLESPQSDPSASGEPPVPHNAGRLTLRVGGGIVADSTAASEYEEALLKAAFAHRAAHPIQLIETMRAFAGEIHLLESHLNRLSDSAAALGFRCDRQAIHQALASQNATGRVRLLLHRTGQVDITVDTAPTWPAALHLALSRQQTIAVSPHLRHKTTFRPEYGVSVPDGFTDTLFQNTRGELTESSIANLLVQLDGRWYTPPLACGVLPGIVRAYLLNTNQIYERTMTLDDLQQSTAAALCNAVRGIAPVTSLQLPDAEGIHWQPPSAVPQQPWTS